MRILERRRALGVAGAAFLATAVFFHRALVSGEAFLARDMLLVYCPLRAYWAERLLSGSFADWYPYDGLGQPFTGMLLSAAFHPLNFLYLVFPLTTALNLNVLLCFPSALGGMYALTRRFGVGLSPAALSGVVFAFSGPLVSSTNNLSYLMAAATVPWALWAADLFLERPSWGMASLAGGFAALVLLAGDVQAFAITLPLLTLLAFCRRARPVLAVTLLFSALAAAMVQLIPAWQVAQESRRSLQTLAQATLWSTHPLRLLEAWVGPLFARDPDDSMGRLIARRLLDSGQRTLWMDSLYFGLPAILLALLGAWVYRRSRTGRTVAVCTGVFLLFALGKRGGLSALAYRFIPFWHVFRYPEKWMTFVALGLALGAAAGLQAVLFRPPDRRRLGYLLAASGLLALALGVEEASLRLFGQWMADRIGSPSPIAELAPYLSGQLARGATVSGLLAMLLSAAFLWTQRPRLLAWSTIGICFVGLLLLNEPQYQLAFSDVLARPSPFLARIRGTPWRVLQLPGSHLNPATSGLSAVDLHALGAVLELEPVTPALFGVEGANTYLPAGSARVFELSDDEPAWVRDRASLFSTRYLSLAQSDVARVVVSGKRLVETLPSFGYALVEDTAALPRAYVASPICVASAAESLAAVQAHQLSAGHQAVVECSRPLPASTGQSGDVLELESAPERVALRVKVAAAAVVVLNDAFYSGWQATVDGVEVPILAANHAARAVAVQPGEHEVIFRYRTPGLWVGLCVTLAFLLGGAARSGLGRALKRLRTPVSATVKAWG